MAKRKVRTKKSSNFITVYKKNIIVATSVLIGVVIIYYISQEFKGFSSIEKPANISMDSVIIDSLNTPQIKKENVRKIQVEILNGCGISNITGQFRNFFKRNDIDIIAVGNYVDFKQHQSFIIYHSIEVKERAEELAKSLNINISLVKDGIIEKPINELTLVLGYDYTKLRRR